MERETLRNKAVIHFNIKKVYSLLLIIVCAYFSGSAVYVTSSFNMSVGISICVVLPFSISLFSQFKSGIKNYYEVFYYLLIFMILVNTVAYVNNVKFNTFIICLITIAFIINCKYTVNEILHAYIYSTLVIAIAAIIGTLLLNNTNLLSNLPTYKSNLGWEYKIGYIYNYMPIIKNRVMGFFWEPGLLATYVSIGLMCYVSKLKRKIILKDIIYISIMLFCIFTSTSAAGYLLGSLCIVYLFLRNSGINSMYRKAFGIILLLLIIIALFYLNDFILLFNLSKDESINKLLISNMLVSGRFTCIFANLDGWIHHFAIGMGLSEAQNTGLYSDTSTSTFIMTVFGVMGILYTVGILYGIWKQKTINVYGKIIITTMAMLIVNKEPHHYMLGTWVLYFLLMRDDVLKVD